MTSPYLIRAVERAAQMGVLWTEAFFAAHVLTHDWDQSVEFAWKVQRMREAARVKERVAWNL